MDIEPLSKRLNVAVVGCGAMAERQHLRLLTQRDDCQIVALVDQNEARLKDLAHRFSVPLQFTEYNPLLHLNLDAAIVTLPNHLHAPVSIELLKAGVHVLVEKPMALSVAECDHMLEAAEAGSALLAVGLMRRYSHAGQFAKWVIDSGLLGQITSFSFQDGFVYAWPTASDAFLRKELAGGGVLIDLGAHTLDQLLWWLGEVESFDYADDSYGGVEADCILELVLKSGAKGRVELSRTRDLSMRAFIKGDKAELDFSLVRNSISIRFLESKMGITGHATVPGQPSLADQQVSDLILAEHEDFFRAIKTGSSLTIPGVEAKRSIALIEACYTARSLLNLPWVEMQSISGNEVIL